MIERTPIEQPDPHEGCRFRRTIRCADRWCPRTLRSRRDLLELRVRRRYATAVYVGTPLISSRCEVCGEELNEVDGSWVGSHAYVQVHTRCVDWRVRPFPYSWALEMGRRTLWIYQRQHLVAGRLPGAVDWLRRATWWWPRGDVYRGLRIGGHAARIVTTARDLLRHSRLLNR